MTAKPHSVLPSPLQTAKLLAAEFALSAVERDERGGTPKTERDALRHSGLLALSIPTQYGGLGARWSDTLGIVREFAKVDSSIAHVFGFHHLMLATVRLFSRPDQWQPWFEQTARKNWFWGNALNPLDTRTVVKDFGGWREFSGKKSFCSGASDSEMLIASAVDENAGGKLLIAAIPSGRSGITLHNDWNDIGQRQTDSGSASFERVRVEEFGIAARPRPAEHAVRLPAPADRTVDLYPYVSRHCRRRLRRSAHLHPHRNPRLAQILGRGRAPRTLTCSTTTASSGWPSKACACWSSEPPSYWTKPGPKGQTSANTSAANWQLPSPPPRSPPPAKAWSLCSRLFEVTGARSTHASCAWIATGATCARKTCDDPVDYKLHEPGTGR